MERFRRRFIEIVQKDSPRQTFGFSPDMQNIACFDLDNAVTSLGGDNKSSMDCLIRIGRFDPRRQNFSGKRWLLVELKLNSSSARIYPNELRKKVSMTEQGLSQENVDPSRNFIFTEELYPQKRSLFENLKRGSNTQEYKTWRCFSPSRFETFLLFTKNLPYVPDNKSEVIQASLTESETSPDDYDRTLRDWLVKADSYQKLGFRNEYFHILKTLKENFNGYLARLEESEDKDFLREEWNFLEKY